MRFGYARIAMQTSECRKCGMCLQGCPYDLIFNTRQTLDRIDSEARFTYLSGLVVRTRCRRTVLGMIVILSD